MSVTATGVALTGNTQRPRTAISSGPESQYSVALKTPNTQLAIGAIAGAVFLLVVFGLLIPPDRGEESAIVLMPFVGGFFGLITALVSSAVYYLGLFLWTRRPHRSVNSRAWLGAACAALGALGFWLIFGFTLSNWPGVPVWGGIGAAAGILAALIAGPLTALSAQRENLQPAPTGTRA